MESYEQLYIYKFNDLDETEKVFERNYLLKLKKKYITWVTIYKEIELIEKPSTQKTPIPDNIIHEFYPASRKEILILHKLF